MKDRFGNRVGWGVSHPKFHKNFEAIFGCLYSDIQENASRIYAVGYVSFFNGAERWPFGMNLMEEAAEISRAGYEDAKGDYELGGK